MTTPEDKPSSPWPEMPLQDYFNDFNPPMDDLTEEIRGLFTLKHSYLIGLAHHSTTDPQSLLTVTEYMELYPHVPIPIAQISAEKTEALTMKGVAQSLEKALLEADEEATLYGRNLAQEAEEICQIGKAILADTHGKPGLIDDIDMIIAKHLRNGNLPIDQDRFILFRRRVVPTLMTAEIFHKILDATSP